MVRMTQTSANCNMSEMFIQLCCGSHHGISCHYLDPLPLKHLVIFQRTVLDHKVQDRILVFAASIHMFDASTFLMGKSPSLRLTSPKKLVLKPLFFMVKSHGGQVFRVKSPCTPQDLGSLAERTG